MRFFFISDELLGGEKRFYQPHKKNEIIKVKHIKKDECNYVRGWDAIQSDFFVDVLKNVLEYKLNERCEERENQESK